MLDNQMNKMFAEGGVMQEGGTVDPVSGNDVPPGAMAEEVRDDIDAKLSEGEFVIPADVVRYIGLEKLMMMRDKAKAGLKRMSEIGQMGNAEEVDDAEALHSDEDEMDDETFSSEIDSIMNEENNQEYAKGGDVRKYAPGGYVGGTENAERYKNAPLSGFEMVVMTNAAGQTMYIPHVNGKPLLPVPAGYRTKSTAADTATPTSESIKDVGIPVTSGSGGSDGGGDSSGDSGNNSNAPGVQGGFSPVSSQSVGIAATALGALGVPGMNIAALGKSAIANTINSFALNSITSNNVNTVAAMMGLDPADPANAAAISAAIDSTPNIGEVTGPTATVGVSGTGGNAASAASSAAAAASAAGHSAEAIGAASQAASDATVNGEGPAAAAAAGAAAAAAADNGNAAEGGNTAANAAAASAGGDSSGSGGDGSAGAATSGDAGWAKGGFVSKNNTKTMSKPKGLAGRRN